MKRKLIIFAVLLLCLGLLAACAPQEGAGAAEGAGTPGEESTPSGAGGSTTEPEQQEYLGTAQGMDGEVTVEVVMQGDTIVSVEVLRHEEEEGESGEVFEKIPQEIVKANSTDVEAVSGATVTSNAIMKAAQNALDERA